MIEVRVMQQKSFLGQHPAGFHRIAYTEWGTLTAKPPVICVHGLTRNGRDFDRLASALENTRQVFCPDITGRGQSEWLNDASYYGYPQYSADMTAMIARTNATQIDWVGTSMGGILGMLMASAKNSPIKKLVINDVGPYLSMESLKRIGSYVAQVPEFGSEDEAEKHMRKIYAPFGVPDDDGWKQLVKFGLRKLPNGKWGLAHDPAIGANFAKLEKDVEFWDVYDRIRCPVLLLRGELSDILTAETARQMTERGPKAKLITLPGIGHAPALMAADQIRLIADFLGH